MAMIDKKALLDGDGMVRWEHETVHGSIISQGLPTEKRQKKDRDYDRQRVSGF